jgi:hypothetical protein
MCLLSMRVLSNVGVAARARRGILLTVQTTELELAPTLSPQKAEYVGCVY